MAEAAAPQPRRTISRESCTVSTRETEGAFADFLSDGSSNEDEDDADSRALLRMQQQADDSMYSEVPFKLKDSNDNSFRLTMKKTEDYAVAGPAKLVDIEVLKPQVEEVKEFVTVEDVMDLVSMVERATCSTAEGYLDDMKPSSTETTEPKRKTSVRETESAFADFLSDGSNSSEEDEDDADTRKLLRMQQQADDQMFVEMKLEDESKGSSSGNSFRLTLAKPGAFDDEFNGPRKLVEEAKRRESAAEPKESEDEEIEEHEDPSFSDVNSFSGDSFVEPVAVQKESLASRPPSFDDEGDSFFDEPRPSFSDEHSFTGGGDSFIDNNNSFVYRPSLPDDEEIPSKTQDNANSFVDVSFVYRPSLQANDTEKEVKDPVQSKSDSSPAFDDSEKEVEVPVQQGVDSSQVLPGNEQSTVIATSSEPSLPDDSEDVNKTTSTTGAGDSSFVYRPTLDEDVPEVVFGYTRPATTATEEESNFVYRVTLPGTDEVQVAIEAELQQESNAPRTGTESPRVSDEQEPSFLSPTASSFIRSSDAIAFNFEAVDSSFRLNEEPVEDNNLCELTPPALDTPEPEKEVELNAKATTTAIPSLSRQSSATSTGSTQDFASQRRLTATRESWRISSLDFRESKHAFDEELGPLAGHPSPRVSTAETEQRPRLSTFQERASAASNSSSFYSQVNFFVDDQQSFSSVSSLSLDSRASGDDSFANVAILGDDGRDENERRSSDIISQDVQSSSQALDRSYSNLVEATAGLDQSFSQLVNREGLYQDEDCSSANGTSLGSSLASSAVSQTSAASDELPFASFNAAKPPPSNQKTQVLYKSLAVPRPEIKPAKPSSHSTGAATFSSAALLAAIKTRDTRTNTRSEETEAGDVALGALPVLAPPLKINVMNRGRGSLSSTLLSKGSAGSPSFSASPLSMSNMTRSSVASSTGTADRLDFTGVYRGSVNSLEASRNTPAETKVEEKKDAVKFELLGVKLERSISDSRMMQRESRQKVEEFFQKTYQKSVDDIDEREVHRWTNRKTRARTTVIQLVDDVQQEPRHFDFANNNAKVIDLKNLRNGGTKPGWHLEQDAPLPVRREDSAKQSRMGMTTGTTSTGTTATQSIPSDVPMAPNYVISPQGDCQRPKVLAKKTPKAASGGRSFSRRAENVSLTPTLPRLSAPESPAFSPSRFMTSLMTPNGFNGSGGPGKSPVAFAGTASGFRWKESGLNGLKHSGMDNFDASGISYTQRPTFADRVQSLSASLASTLRRFLPGRNPQPNEPGVTSPQSQCTAPASLPRAYDHNGFYRAPFQVPGLNNPLGQRKEKEAESDEAWARQWLILATCAVAGLSLGAILVRVVIFDSSVFNLSPDDVHERQESNGELLFAAGVRWLLLPGQLFLRVWSAVTTLLLFCYVVTGLADLVGCADKSELVVTFRSIGYALLLAIVAVLEGILALWLAHHFGWFRGQSSTASTRAVELSNAIGATPLPLGAVGLLCSGEKEYLQDLGHDVFACSNSSLTLPLYQEVATNSTGITDSGPAVFALREVTEVLATPPSNPYYPKSLGSETNMALSLLSELTPDNILTPFSHPEADEMATLGGMIAVALLLGFMCGKRILSLRRDAQAAMFETARSNAPDPHQSRHYIVGVVTELQLALEWLIRPMERYLAPGGFFSLMLGNILAHHREWRSFTSPMASLIVGVLTVVVLHAVLVLPMVLKQFSSNRRRLSLFATTRAFVPTFLFSFTTNNVALSAPVTMQCFSRVQTVTRSAAQLTTAVTASLTRNARALYLPLLLLWLLETSTSEEIVLSTGDYFSIGLLSLLSSFCGGSTRLTLAMARTLWSIAVGDETSSILPATMPLLVVCDVVLSRVASVVNVADHLVLTHLAAQHWGETVVHGVASSTNVHQYVPSPSPLDDSQAPRPSSSAMLSSVYL
ncbi:Excitatory amino acid transporter [Phytophthora citrophthora]|uniref:Excitatory amino acid transporter n=1 Tax=Phytophthora citrophthora TaxID=4793 RepID=A0AAD9GBP8_9STRA|nr:Excitatory amino acid transporter [Phytophthora citrophthora]